jgi:hypothetical protein
MAISYGGDIIETIDYGTELKLSAVTFDVKSEKVIIIYESKDEEGYSGRHLTTTITQDGMTCTGPKGSVTIVEVTYDSVTPDGIAYSEEALDTLITDNITVTDLV